MKNSEEIARELRALHGPMLGEDLQPTATQFRKLLGGLLKRDRKSHITFDSADHGFELLGTATTAADVVRAKEFLRGLVLKMDKITRNNSPELSWVHSERVAEQAYNFARLAYGDDKAKLNKVVVIALMHDAVEDFGATLTDVERLFGKDVAQSVALLSTPKPPVLAHKYQDIAAKFLPQENLHALTAESIEKKLAVLKKTKPRRYKALTDRLEARYKRDAMKVYGLDEVIVKIADNGDVPHADAKDIAAGCIQVIRDNTPGRPALKPGQKAWSKRKIGGKVAERMSFHMVLLTRLIDIRGEHSKQGFAEIGRHRFDALIAQTDQFFKSKIVNLSVATGVSFAVLPAPAPI